MSEQKASPFQFSTSRQFMPWLMEQNVSLAITTYQAGKLFLLGTKPHEELSIFARTFPRCMGLCHHEGALYLSSLFQLWRLENALGSGQITERGYDRLYVPQVSYTTGDLDIHDIGVDTEGKPLFVNTLFGCLATVSQQYSFVPVWRPPFISRLAAEDRCHLNGLAMEGGIPRYVTCASQTDINDGWRDHLRNGGTVIDVQRNEIVAEGLSMPHSPRLYRGELWVHNSGTGYFGKIDLARGLFEPITFCPGYLRGLAFVGDFAIVGLSKPRKEDFAALPLQENLQAARVEARCGLQIIDLRTGDVVHWLRLDGAISELYDVVALPGAVRPMALNYDTDEIRRTVTTPGMKG